MNALLDRVEDVYDSNVHNLDAFVADLQHALGDHPVFKLVANAIETFVVHYVLNRFDGVRTSYDSAVQAVRGEPGREREHAPHDPQPGLGGGVEQASTTPT